MYNGWKNRATYLVNKWAGEDPLFRTRWFPTAKEIFRLKSNTGLPFNVVVEQARFAFAEYIRGDIKSMLPKVSDPLYKDLLQDAVESVDYYDIAEAWIDNVRNQ